MQRESQLNIITPVYTIFKGFDKFQIWKALALIRINTSYAEFKSTSPLPHPNT